MIRRILKRLVRGRNGFETTSGTLTWDRFRTGYVSGPYVITPNRGGGAVVSYNGRLLNDGKMLPNLSAAQAFCERHHAGLPAFPHNPGWSRDMSYAVSKQTDDGTWAVDTPARGFSLIKGLNEQMAYAVERAINRAYENGCKDTRQNIKDALGIEDCCHD